MDDKIKLSIDDYTKEELYNLAFFETVTKFYNWTWMRDRIDRFELYGIDDFILIHFDVKDFKIINEIYGHTVGDNLLISITKAIMSKDWTLFACRCDNDNFAIMAKRMPDEDLRKELEKLFDELSVLPEDKSYTVYFRCGVASINDVADYRVTITDMAKMAQIMGKQTNVTEINFYTDKMKDDEIKGKIIKSDLPRALSENEFLVYYQPKFNPNDDSIIGAEALIRWNYHKKEIWAPGKFVPYLEKENAIGVLDLFVLEEVCKKLEYWSSKGYKLVPISVNMSKTQLYNKNVISKILDIVNKYNVDRKYIEFELTESVAYEDEQYMLKIMHRLREEGFLLSIDDFGTGYSSLNLLSIMPLTTLKIDKSFIDEIEDNSSPKICHIIKDIVKMTKHLKITSVAEGVETKHQKDLIQQWGCNAIQGYYYSKPLPENEFENLIIA